MLISTPLSPNPYRNLLWSDNALFPIWKKERKSISGFNTHRSQSILPLTLFFSSALFLQFSLHLWQMVNRNNGVWLLGGQGAAGGENKAADESAWAGITQASMPLTSLLSATDKRAAKTDSHRKKTQHIFNLHIEEEKSYKVLGFFFFFALLFIVEACCWWDSSKLEIKSLFIKTSTYYENYLLEFTH